MFRIVGQSLDILLALYLCREDLRSRSLPLLPLLFYLCLRLLCGDPSLYQPSIFLLLLTLAALQLAFELLGRTFLWGSGDSLFLLAWAPGWSLACWQIFLLLIIAHTLLIALLLHWPARLRTKMQNLRIPLLPSLLHSAILSMILEAKVGGL